MFCKIWMLFAPSVWRNCVCVKAACPFIKSLWIETWWNVSANITCCCVSSPCTIVGGSPWLLASRHTQQWRRRGIIVLLVIFQLWVIISWYKMTPTDTESWAHETVSQSQPGASCLNLTWSGLQCQADGRWCNTRQINIMKTIFTHMHCGTCQWRAHDYEHILSCGVVRVT